MRTVSLVVLDDGTTLVNLPKGTVVTHSDGFTPQADKPVAELVAFEDYRGHKTYATLTKRPAKNGEAHVTG